MADNALLGWNPQQPMTDDAYDAYVAFLHDFAPSRFLLIGIADDRTDAGVLGWGMAWEDEVVAYLTRPADTGRPVHVQARSAESIRASVAHRHEVRLAWIDPDPGHP